MMTAALPSFHVGHVAWQGGQSAPNGVDGSE